MESDNEDAAKWPSCFSGNIRLNWFYWLGQPIILCASAPSPSSSGSSPHPWSSGFLTQVQPNFFPCRSHLACVVHMTHYMDGNNNLSAAAEKRRDVFIWHSARVLLIRINWDYLLTHQKRVCCIHVIVCAQDPRLCFSTWMLQEISESSSNRIVQRTSWSRERLLGLRNRSIFILVLIRFQLLASADAQPEQKHAGSVHKRTHARTCMRLSFGSLFVGGEWKDGDVKGWVGEWMDATELEEGETPHASCLSTGLPTGGRCVFTPPPVLAVFTLFGILKKQKTEIKYKIIMFSFITLIDNMHIKWYQ